MTGRPTPRRPDGSDPFGEVLPDRTVDEERRGWEDDPDTRDEWLRTEVPPHHG